MIGFRILRRARKVDPEVVARFRQIPVANVSDSMYRMSAGGARLRPMHKGGRMAGLALTVKTRPGDNLMVHKALDLAERGDVIVVDAGGDLTNALIGEIMSTYASARGIAGFVIDGAIRDIAEWAEGGMPVFAKGHTHRGPSKDGPGEVNVPIACAGLAVNPGDLVLGDADGVIAIAAAEADALLPKVQAQIALEAKMRESNAKGIADHERFNALLRSKGVPI